jgi:hypothetical protein
VKAQLISSTSVFSLPARTRYAIFVHGQIGGQQFDGAFATPPGGLGEVNFVNESP